MAYPYNFTREDPIVPEPPVEPGKPVVPPKQDSSFSTLIIVGGLLVAFWIYNSGPAVTPDPINPTPVVVPVEDLAGVKAVVDKADPKKVGAIGELMLAMGDTLSRAEPVSSEVVRAWIIDTQTYRIQGTDLMGGIGLGPELERLFVDALGLDSRMLTKDEMKQASDILTSVGQICINARK